MKIFFDCEFTGLHQKTTLISIGLVSECGKTFYAEFTDYDKTQCDKWIDDNVIKNLKFKDSKYIIDSDIFNNFQEFYSNKFWIKSALKAWLKQFESIEMWADCLAYDWVLFNDLMADYKNGYPELPQNINYIPFDICTLFEMKGIDPDINREEFAKEILTRECFQSGPKHNALWDAYVIKACYNKLITT